MNTPNTKPTLLLSGLIYYSYYKLIVGQTLQSIINLEYMGAL